MKNFARRRPADVAGAAAGPDAAFIAGGTTVIDLWKLDAYPFSRLVDLAGVNLRGTSAGPAGLKLGALERMSTVGDHAGVKAAVPTREACEVPA
jgi:xanthine dehydrogenase YagS FAD-binding subunit